MCTMVMESKMHIISIVSFLLSHFTNINQDFTQGQVVSMILVGSDAQGYSCNFPFHPFYLDKTFIYAVDRVFTEVHSHFKPDVIVVQCGADAFSRDPNGGAGFTIKGYCICIENILKIQKPVLLLGGGGYNHSNTAKLWTAITAQIAGVKLDENIPEHSFWSKYGPDYTLTVESLLTRDLNTTTHIDTTISTIKDNLNKYLEKYGSQDKLNKIRKIRLIRQPRYMLKCSMDNKKHGKKNKEKNPIDVYEFNE